MVGEVREDLQSWLGTERKVKTTALCKLTLGGKDDLAAGKRQSIGVFFTG